VSRRYLLGWLGFAAAIALLATVSGLSSVAISFADASRFEQVEANKGALIAGAWRSLAFVAGTVGLAFAISRGTIPRRFAVWAIAGLIAVDLWSIERLYWLFSPPAEQIYASDTAIDAVKAEPQPTRVLTLGQYRDAFVTGDALMGHRVRVVTGYHGNELGRYDQLIDWRGSRENLLNPNILQLTNTKFVLTHLPELPFFPGVRRLRGPVRSAEGNDLYLFELPEHHPYAWVTPVAVKASDEQVLATLLDPRFDVTRAALFDTSAEVTVASAVRALPDPLAITTNVRRYEPGNVRIDLSAPAPAGASLVVSENYYPGWQATVDGKPARLGRADLTLIGVELPQGARSVELEFTSPAYQKGKTVTWIAILIGVLALAAGFWRDRRRVA
jgi:hypothetical protein